MMRRIDRSALVPFGASDMFSLVDDISAYPEFLPWCLSANEISRDKQHVEARLGVGFESLSTEFTTRNTWVGEQEIHMQLVEGPFSELKGLWSFEPVGESGCQVNLDMQFEFRNKAKDLLLGSVFEKICDQLIDAFVQRAHQTLGASSKPASDE